MPPGASLVATRNLSKSFGAHRVLHRVSIDLRAGEVHVLAGENGAGKSSLLRILSGADSDYSGDLVVQGSSVRFSSPTEARRAGIAAIYQELSLVGTLTVAENLVLGQGSQKLFARLNAREDRTRATKMLRAMDLALDPDSLVEDLSVSTRQLVEVARALAADAQIVIMDEPTSALSEPEAEVLFRHVGRLRDEGRGVLFVSHKMEEMYRIADRITVLRDGVLVGTEEAKALPRQRLVAWMAGQDDEARMGHSKADEDSVGSEVLLEARDLRTDGDRDAVAGVSLTLRQGEIVGLAGLRGSGTTALLEGLFGARRASGRVRFAGEDSGRTSERSSRSSSRSPAQSIEQGIVYLSNDRRSTGLFLERDVVDNATLASLSRFARWGWIDRSAEREATGRLALRTRLAAPSLDALVGTLSGGNQQKVYLARCLLASPKVLLLDEPTRGVDVGAKADIHALLREAAAGGAAVLLFSTELDELLELCDRILVMHAGVMAAELTRGDATREKVLAAALGAAASAAPAATPSPGGPA